MGTQNKRFGAIRDLSLTESNRLQLQAAIDSSKGIEDRRRLGQFATPFELAQEIVSLSSSIPVALFKILDCLLHSDKSAE